MRRTVELLAPVGNIDSFKAAVNAGANAVYMGLGKHNARTMAKNFTIDEYIECIHYAHMRDVLVYLTLNTLVYDGEVEEALELLLKLYENGLDAVILQDIGLADIIRKSIPDLPMHASTQMSAYSIEQVKFLEEFGFKRVVLARELTIDEIKRIKSETEIEIEVFVHGALCVSLSGQCLLSSTIGTRSANRGACAQPCRMRYSLLENNNELVRDTYLLSKKDIYGLDLISKLVDIGVTSFKIEGRNKIPEYVALVVSKYRKYIDKYIEGSSVKVEETDEKQLLQMFSRDGKSHGYLNGVSYKSSITLNSPKNTGLYLGEVLAQNKDYVKIKIMEDIDLHDGIEIYSSNNTVSNIITCIKNDRFKIINDSVSKGQIVWLGDIKEKVFVGDRVYKTSSSSLNSYIQKEYLAKNYRRRKMTLNVTIKKDSPIILNTIINGSMYMYNTNIVPEDSINSDITLESIENTFRKTQDTAFEFNNVIGYVEKGLFVKISTLNEIRRLFIQKIKEKYTIKRNVIKEKNAILKYLNELEYCDYTENITESVNSIFVYKYDKNVDYIKYYSSKYNKEPKRIDFSVLDFIKHEEEIFEKYSKLILGVNIPNFVLNNLDRYIKENLERLIKKGVRVVVLGTMQYLDMLLSLKESYDFELVGDYSLNILNKYSALCFKNIGFDRITIGTDLGVLSVRSIAKVIGIEVIDDYITVMNSRYCMIGSFAENREEEKTCSMPCISKYYYLRDSYNEKYNILCDHLDCTMRIVKRFKQDKEILSFNQLTKRNTII